MMKCDRIGDVRVEVLFVRQGDIEADAATASLISAFVGGLHNAGPATSYNGMAVLSKKKAELFGKQDVFVVVWNARRAKNRDALRKSTNFAETLLEVVNVTFNTIGVFVVDAFLDNGMDNEIAFGSFVASGGVCIDWVRGHI